MEHKTSQYLVCSGVYVGFQRFRLYSLIAADSPEEALARAETIVPTGKEAEIFGDDAYRVTPEFVVGEFSEDLIAAELTDYLADYVPNPKRLEVIEIDKAFHRQQTRRGNVQ